MAKHSSRILELARKGAEHRYRELRAEIAALRKYFPELGGGASRHRRPSDRRVLRTGRDDRRATAEAAPDVGSSAGGRQRTDETVLGG
jgi:hypothetical protein